MFTLRYFIGKDIAESIPKEMWTAPTKIVEATKKAREIIENARKLYGLSQPDVEKRVNEAVTSGSFEIELRELTEKLGVRTF